MPQFNYQIFDNNPLYITIISDNNEVYFADHPGHGTDHESYTLNSGVNLFENGVTIEASNDTYMVKYRGQKLEPVKILANSTTSNGFPFWLLILIIVILIIFGYLYLNRSKYM